MAFSFGASSSSTPSLFGGGTASFGAPASTPSLFGASTPSFGATSASSLFGGLSTPAFGASSASSLFGSSFSTPSSTPSLFGSTPAFGQSTGGAFSFSTSSSLFGTTSALSQTQAGFGSGQQSAPTFGGQPQGGVHGGIGTTDNKPITHYTKWEEISPAGQQHLLQLETRLMEMKEESRQLELCPRLQDAHSEQLGSSETVLRHNLKGLASSWLGDEEEVIALHERVYEVLHSTEVAVRTFQRAYRWREVSKAGQGQSLQSSIREMLGAPVVLPSEYLQKSVATFKKNVEQYYAIVVELEKLLPTTSRQAAREDADTLLRSIPATMQNMSDLFKFASAKLAALHERVEALKDGCLDTLQAEGEYRDPFQDAERQERERANAARSRSPLIPPVQAQTGANPDQNGPPQLQLTNAATSPIAGQAFGAGTFVDANKSSSSKKTKARK